MDCQLRATDIDDAKDIFLLAKDRLLDINDWKMLLKNTDYDICLTSVNGKKVHRDARVGDKVRISTTNKGISADMWTQISQIQYDYFPDIDSETISILFHVAFSPSGNGIDYFRNSADSNETIIIKREKDTLTVHCNTGCEIPQIEDNTPDAHIINQIELHPVLSIPKPEMAQLLKGFISLDEYAA